MPRLRTTLLSAPGAGSGQLWSELCYNLTIMKTVGVLEAKTNLSKLLDAVEQGEEIVITRHGKPVARVVPPNAAAENGWRQFIETAKQFRIRLEPGETVKDYIVAGRKR